MRKNRKRISKKALYNKTRLRLPELDQAKAAVLNTLRTPDSQRGYEHAIDEFIEWYCSEPRLSFNRMVVVRSLLSKLAFSDQASYSEFNAAKRNKEIGPHLG